MFSRARVFLGALFHFIIGGVTVAAAGFALSACAFAGAGGENSAVISELHRADRTYVRIERIEPGAAGQNAHPFVTSPEALQGAFANLKVKGTISADPKPVFTDAELNEIVPHIAAALGLAGVGEDVTFAVTGEHGWFGKYSPKSLTTGRVFVADGKLNLIFGHVHERDDTEVLPRTYKPGSRKERLEIGWSIVSGAARQSETRTDWAVIDVATLTVAPPVPTKPAIDSRYGEIEGKLRVLDRLKANGLISEEEYRERRRAILQQL